MLVREPEAHGELAPLSQLAAPFSLGVHLGAEQEGERGKPEPQEHDDHRRERAPGLVVATELRRIERERSGRDEPDKDRDRRPEAEEPPTRMVHVGAEVVQGRQRRQEAADQDRPLSRPPDIGEEALDAERIPKVPFDLRPEDQKDRNQQEGKPMQATMRSAVRRFFTKLRWSSRS